MTVTKEEALSLYKKAYKEAADGYPMVSVSPLSEKMPP